MSSESTENATIIKKYPNRRLYDTDTSMYITLDDLCQMVKAGKDFVVIDAKSGQDLTRQTLTQIIFEQENKGQQLLPISFLRSVIGFYDDNMGGMLNHYLEASMKTFMGNQEKIRSYMGKTMQGLSPLSQLEELTRQNVTMFERTMQMFNPFGSYFGSGGSEDERPKRPKR